MFATRTLIFIEAPQPIGLMCIVEVGMADVSTCEVTVNKNDTLTKGQEIGMFHHGGSTNCYLFRKDADLTWATNAFLVVSNKNIPLRGALARVSSVSDREEEVRNGSREDPCHHYLHSGNYHQEHPDRHHGVTMVISMAEDRVSPQGGGSGGHHEGGYVQATEDSWH
jgi:hypothetical protein